MKISWEFVTLLTTRNRANVLSSHVEHYSRRGRNLCSNCSRMYTRQNDLGQPYVTPTLNKVYSLFSSLHNQRTDSLLR